MVHVSVTRLRLRSFRFFFPLVWHTNRVNAQIRAADGCLASDVRGGPKGIFWTKSIWRDAAAMRAFMSSGAHLAVMPKLKHWCDEASAGHWAQEGSRVTWAEAESGLARTGWLTKVLRPSAAHIAGAILGSAK